MRSVGNDIPSYTLSVVWERQEPLLLNQIFNSGQVMSDGVDETGDANRTLVWVTHRTTGRDGHMTIGSIQTHSLNEQNSRRAANVEREVCQPSIGYLKRRLHTETVGGISHGSVPCLRPTGRIVRRLVVTFRRATQIGLRR